MPSAIAREIGERAAELHAGGDVVVGFNPLSPSDWADLGKSLVELVAKWGNKLGFAFINSNLAILRGANFSQAVRDDIANARRSGDIAQAIKDGRTTDAAKMVFASMKEGGATDARAQAAADGAAAAAAGNPQFDPPKLTGGDFRGNPTPKTPKKIDLNALKAAATVVADAKLGSTQARSWIADIAASADAGDAGAQQIGNALAAGAVAVESTLTYWVEYSHRLALAVAQRGGAPVSADSARRYG